MPQTLTEIVEPNRPDPFSHEIAAAARESGANYNSEALHAAVLATNAGDLPPALAKAKKQIEAAEVARKTADAKLQAAIQKQQAYDAAVRELADRNTRLAAQVQRLENAKATIAHASSTLQGIIGLEHVNPPGGMVNFLSELSLCREIVEFMPSVIEAERLQVASLQLAADRAASDCEID